MDFQDFSGRGTESFLSAVECYGHELQVLLKMCNTGRKSFENSLEKLTDFVVEILMSH